MTSQFTKNSVVDFRAQLGRALGKDLGKDSKGLGP
jgi:hypothetical protein